MSLVQLIDPVSDPRWDAFIQNHPHRSIYSSALWKDVVFKTYGYQPFYFILENELGKIQAALPLFRVKSFLTGNRMVSLPFADYSDPLLLDSSELDQIFDKVRSEMRQLGATYLEIRTRKNAAFFGNSSFQSSVDSLNHRLPLKRDPTALLNTFHKSFIVRNIKKALKSNLRVEMSEKESTVKIFYNLLVFTRRKHGLPPQPFQFYQNIWQAFRGKGLVRFFTAYLGKVPVAAILVVTFGETAYYLYGGSNPKHLQNRPNHLLLWKAIEWSAQQNYRYFDFGRTGMNNPGLLQFKRNWGTEEFPIYTFWYSHSGKPAHLLNRGNKDQSKIKKIIRRLPFPLLKIGGKMIYRHLG